MWTKKSSTMWVNLFGNCIIKYRMAGHYYFLCYNSSLDFEFGDYVTKDDLNSAKLYFDKRVTEMHKSMALLLKLISSSESKGVNFKTEIDNLLKLERVEKEPPNKDNECDFIRDDLIEFLNTLGNSARYCFGPNELIADELLSKYKIKRLNK